eukprot:1687871-Amphidinium_carterae.1
MRCVEATQKELTRRAQEECEYLRTVAHATSRPPAGNGPIKEEMPSPKFGGNQMRTGAGGSNPQKGSSYVCCGCRQEIIGEVLKGQEVVVCPLSSQGSRKRGTEARITSLATSKAQHSDGTSSGINEEP